MFVLSERRFSFPPASPPSRQTILTYITKKIFLSLCFSFCFSLFTRHFLSALYVEISEIFSFFFVNIYSGGKISEEPDRSAIAMCCFHPTDLLIVSSPLAGLKCEGCAKRVGESPSTLEDFDKVWRFLDSPRTFLKCTISRMIAEATHSKVWEAHNLWSDRATTW